MLLLKTKALAAIVLVNLAVTGFAQNTLTVSPQQVGMAAPAGSTAAAVQNVTLSSAGGSVPFSSSVRYLSSTVGWLAVSNSAETTPATLALSADPTNLAAGTYLAQVVISAGVLGTYVDVFFSVGSDAGGNLAANPTGLTFIGQQGVNILPPQTISVFDRRGSASGFSAFATSSGNWLSVSPTSGTTPGNLTVVAVQAGLPPGTLNGTITLKPSDGGTPTVLPVTLLSAGSSVAATLTLYQTALTFNHQVGTTAPPLQVVAITASTGFANYTASTTTPWIRLTSFFTPTPSSSISAQAPGEFNVLVDPTGLTPGTYVGAVTASAPGAQSRELPVSLTVTPGAALNANPSSVFFANFDPGLGPGTATVTVTSTGSSSLNFVTSVSPANSWLSASPISGSTEGGFQLITVTGDPTGLAPGTYNGIVTLTAEGDSLKIPVVMTVIGFQGSSLLVLPTTSLNLNSLVDGTAPSQTLDIGSLPAGTTHDFTANASSAGGWLSVTPFTGVAPGKLTINVKPGAVPSPGTYDGSVIITSLLTGQQDTIFVRFNLSIRTISVEPASLSFVQQQRGVAPPAQTIQVRANGASTFTVTTAPSWIRVSSSSGSTPSPLTVSVDPTGLLPGSHSGTIRITGPNNLVSVPVSLAVPEPPAPAPNPASLAVSYELGSPAPQPVSINVGSTGNAVVSFAATAKTESGVEWLTVTPSSGSTPSTVTATVNTALVVPGQHQAAIILTPTDPVARPGVVSVTLNVSASGAAVQTLLHGAALSPTPVAPGQIVTIKGSGLGPSTGVAASPTAAGAFETRLAGTRVLFDGVPAPLLYVRDDQINAIAPYALYGRFSTRIQVEAGTSFSVPIEARVVDAAPGIFTFGSSGRGQAAVLNQDFTINSAANPALRGSIISVFGTGEGQTDPPGQDGRVIVTDLRRPLLNVTARIGGRLTEVTYAGSAPSLVSGVFQANIRIPEDIEPGAVSIEIQVGETATQQGVTVAIR